MSTLLTPRLLLYGFLSWLIPLAVSVAFFGPGGTLWIPQPLFKSLMVVTGAASGLWLLLRAMRHVAFTPMRGLQLGLIWMVMNLVLDAAVLVPLAHMDLRLWFMDIGVRYAVIALAGWALGVAATLRR